MNLNAAPSPFPIVQIHEDHDRRHSHINEPFVSNNIVASASASASSSSSSLSCHSLFHSTQQHDAGYNYHQEDDNYAYNQSGSSSSSSHDMIKNKNENKLWEKESEDEKNNYPVKWMSSKMRLKYNPTKVEEDHEKLVLGSSMDLSSSANMMSCSYNNININNNNNNNNVIRVCSDCSTTKTPLWRSGPKGPKSLCNACGIRQRKARRTSGMAVVSDEPPAHIKEIKNTTTTTTTTTNSVGKINYNASSTIQLRKRFMKMTTSAAGSTSIGAGTPSIYNGPKKIEEFLIHFSNNLAASQLRVCPEDEKDAAILLMALSSGLFHTN